ETRVVADLARDRGERLRLGAVVADDADPVAVRLGPDRAHLAREEVAGRFVGRHADRDERAVRRRRRAQGGPGGRGRDGDAGEHGLLGPAALEVAKQAEVDLATVTPGDARDAPEAAAVAVRVLERAVDVQSRHAVRTQPLRLAVDDQTHRPQPGLRR